MHEPVNNIGDAGAAALANMLSQGFYDEVKELFIPVMKNLVMMDLHSNRISDHGAKLLADALKENDTLTVLDLSRNYISDAGCQFFCDALQENSAIKVLNLIQNPISVRNGSFIYVLPIY